MVAPSLSNVELLDAAAVCQSWPSVNASVYLAALAMPDMSLDESAHLTIGARDAVLVRFHAATFGSGLELATNCPRCMTRLDVNLTSDALAIEPNPDIHIMVDIDEQPFEVRPLTSVDLLAVAESPDIETSRMQLALRCLVPVEGAGVPEVLLDDQIDAVASALAAIDPGSDFYVSLNCFECKANWDAPVDIARVLSTDIEAAADTLMDDIHDIALAYHWSEADILALPSTRRSAYLQRLRQ